LNAATFSAAPPAAPMLPQVCAVALTARRAKTERRRLDSIGSRCFDVDAELIFAAKAVPMLRITALALWVFIAIEGAATAEDAKPDTVLVHGKPIELSCAEWKRNQDGSWTSIGALLVGTDTLRDVTLRGAKETGALEAKCRNPSSPAAAPSPSGDPTRHTKAKKPPAAPADGT
jgi:hypothetical protein